MGQHDPIKALRSLLQDTISEMGTDHQVELGAKRTLVISRRGHWRGMWQFVDGQYGWVAAGNTQPEFRTADINDAAAFAIKTILVH